MVGSAKAVDIVDDAVIWTKRSADPWSRLQCCKEPILIVVEFCQVQGPRPLYACPADAGPHLDLDSVAVWLMSSEAIHGASMILYNQQMGLYACVHHSALQDIQARAFQRPISLALLTSTKPTTAIIKEFINISRRLFSPVLKCNHILFRSHLIRLAKLTDNMIQLLAVSNLSLRKINSVAEQARQILPRFQSESWYLSSDNVRCCTLHSAEEDLEFLSALGSSPAPLLKAMHCLAPCAFDAFLKTLPVSRNRMLNVTKASQFGALFCADYPVLLLRDRDNHILDGGDEAFADNERTEEDEKILASVVGVLDKMLYAILSGQKLAVWALKEHKSRGEILLKKLNLTRAYVHRQGVVWKEHFDSLPEDCRLFGHAVPHGTSFNDYPEANLCVFDVTGRHLKSKDYSGKLLSGLSRKRPATFPSDYALISHIVARLTEFCCTVFVARYNDLGRLIGNLEINKHDLVILVNLLSEIDYLRYGAVKEKVSKKESTVMVVAKV